MACLAMLLLMAPVVAGTYMGTAMGLGEPRGACRDRTLYTDPPPLPAGIWPESAGPWAPKAA